MRGQTTAEFAAANGPYWMYAGGLPGDPGWVSDAARAAGDRYNLDAECLDDMMADAGWEHHDAGYDEELERRAWMQRAREMWLVEDVDCRPTDDADSGT